MPDGRRANGGAGSRNLDYTRLLCWYVMKSTSMVAFSREQEFLCRFRGSGLVCFGMASDKDVGIW